MLEDVLKETYGIFVYQEQVMKAAQVLAGYSLGEADLLRRAMGKKIQSEMNAQRARFVSGAAANDIGPAKASELFDLIDKFAGYGFNKSHAAAYALVAYHTAWLKAHHPPEFFAASMSFDMAQTDKLALFVEDIRRAGVECLPPVRQRQPRRFLGRGRQGALRPGRAEGRRRESDGSRWSPSAPPTARTRASTISPSGSTRGCSTAARSKASPPPARSIASRPTAPRCSPRPKPSSPTPRAPPSNGRAGRAGCSAGRATPGSPRSACRATRNWTLAERMTAERDAFGFYFSAHPIDQQRHLLAAHKVRAFAELASLPAPADGGRTMSMMAGLVEEARWRTSAKGRRYMLATLSDATGQFVATAFDDEPSAALEAAAKASRCGLLTVELDRRPGEDAPRVTVKRFQPLDALAKRARLQMTVRVADLSTVALDRQHP